MFSRHSTVDRTEAKPIDPRTANGAGLPPPVMPGSALFGAAPGTGGVGHSGSHTAASAALPAGAAATVGAASVGSFSTRSIIGNDLTIMGQGLRIITRGTLQVDGRIEGDVIGTEVIIGEHGHVTGVVSGESVTVRGQVQGTIKAMTVALQSGAHVEGDVHHRQLSVEQGALLDGRVRRPEDVAELRPDLGPVVS